MTDTTQLPNSTDGSEPNEEDVNGDQKDTAQNIFDDLFHKLMDGFGKACEKEDVEIAFAVAVHPDHPNPIVFYRGEMLDAMSLAASLLRDYKANLYARLDGEPRPHMH